MPDLSNTANSANSDRPVSPLLRIGIPFLVLVLFYRGAHVEIPGSAAVHVQRTGLSPAEAAKLLENSKVLRAEGKYDDAAELTRKVAEAFPDNYIYWEQLAGIYDRAKRWAEEAQALEKVLPRTAFPEDICPHIGDVYKEQGLVKEAIDAYSRCLSLLPNNTDSLFAMARMRERTGELDEAARLYRKGMELAPEYWDHYVGLARILLRQGKSNESLALVKKVLVSRPNDIDALFLLGLIQRRQEKLPQAERTLARALALAPGYDEVRETLESVRAARRGGKRK